jgi:hypothetical protein
MKYCGIYCRSDHPTGYGMHNGTAHGYVTMLVSSDTNNFPGRITGVPIGKFMNNPGWWDTWYGGNFDLVAIIPHVEGDPLLIVHSSSQVSTCASYGDNRAIACVTIEQLNEEVLGGKTHFHERRY